jgi:hypothetical protein
LNVEPGFEFSEIFSLESDIIAGISLGSAFGYVGGVSKLLGTSGGLFGSFTAVDKSLGFVFGGGIFHRHGLVNK